MFYDFLNHPVSKLQFISLSFENETSTHSELLVYDWAVPSSVETVVEDVERIDFEQYGKHDQKLQDWRRIDEWDWNNSRRM